MFILTIASNKQTLCKQHVGSLNVNADGTYSNNYALKVYIINDNCVKIYAAVQQVEQAARELREARKASGYRNIARMHVGTQNIFNSIIED